ncbi:MAG: DsbA family protein, partial [bacterium]
MPKFLSLLVVLFTLFPSSSRAASPTEPIVLDLYIMGLCPFAQILEANLAPLLEDPALGSRVKTNLNFIVTEKKDGSLKSLHGKKELLEDQRQLLINHYHPDKLWTYLKCRARNPDYKVCAEKAGLNPAEIERAVKSGEGMKLLKENRKKAERKGVSSSPTVFLNGKRFPEKQKLPRRLCRFHTPPTRPCHNLEEMEWVWDDTPVVSSGSCQDKNGVEMTLSVVKPSQSLFDKTGFLVSQLTRTFPKLQPRFYTPDTWSGPVFSRLPVYLFDKRVAQSTKFFDFTKNLSARKDGYLLKA